MSKVKKVIAGTVAVALVTAGIAGGLNYMKKANQKEVAVTSVSGLATSYYIPDTTLEGHITTSVSQNVTVDKDMIIEEVYVQKGDNVNVGDKLISFDMTLVEMELKIAKLKRQKEEQDLNKAINRLNSLQNGGPIEENDGSSSNADNLNKVNEDELDNEEGNDDLGSLAGTGEGNYLAVAIKPLLLAAAEASAFDDGAEAPEGADPSAPGENEEATGGSVYQEGPSYQDPSAGDFTSGENPFEKDPDSEFTSGQSGPPKPSPTPTPKLDADTDFFDPYHEEGDSNITDGNEPFYQKLDSNTVPFTGSGTEDDPYIFLCSSAKGTVTAMGSFFNKMAGYSEDGTKIVQEGGYWYQLEFHLNDTIADYADRTQSCTGYYLIDGSLLEKPVDMYGETEFTLEGASHYEEEIPIPDDNPVGDVDTPPAATLTRAEAIKIQQTKIGSLKLDLQESDIKITKLEKKVSRQVVYSKLDGTVSYVGDVLTGVSEGNAFIKIKSKDGFYVKGSVSELMLDKMKEGTKLSCMSYNAGAGTFEAEVVDVSDYPISSQENYYGEGNPNVSYYSYSAVIPDKSVKVSDQEWITVTLKASEAEKGSFVLSKAFVRTENGSSFVYKDEKGTLKKQIISVGASVDGGINVLIKGGISQDDKIAFPYGKTAQEGAKTREVDANEFYGY